MVLMNGNELQKKVEEYKDITLSDEVLDAIEYESRRIYVTFKLISEELKQIHFCNSWEPIEIFFDIIFDKIKESNKIDSTRITCDYDKDWRKFYLNMYIDCLTLKGVNDYYSNCSLVIMVPESEKFDSNEIVSIITDKIESLNEKDIYSTIESGMKRFIENYDKKYLLSLLSYNHINRLFNRLQKENLSIINYTTPEIHGLSDNINNSLKMNSILNIEHKKNLECGNQALYLKLGDEYIGYLPDGFGDFLCPGIDSGRIAAYARVVEIIEKSTKSINKIDKVIVKVKIKKIEDN